MARLRLVQLPVPQPAALAATGNVPLAAGCLGVAARVHGLAARGLELEVLAPDVTDSHGDTLLADRVARDEPEFVGLSLYLWNVERSLHLAREVKRRSPRTTILIGGPEVGADNPFVLHQPGYDVAVTGEAEDTFGAVMKRLLDGENPRGLPGVSVRGPLGMSAFGPPPSANFPLTAYPSPYTEALLPVDPQRATYLETVRGCRSHCTYCFYPRSSNVLRVLDVPQTETLVRGLAERGARELVFLDPTFNHRPELEALLGAMARANPDRQMSCFGEIRAEGMTAEHVQLFAKAGFTKLELGLQSINKETLRRVRRGGKPEQVAQVGRMLRDVGVELLVDLIIGLPGDTAEDVAAGVEFLKQHELGDHAQVFILSLLPGTAMRGTAAADGLIYDEAPPYRLQHNETLDREALRDALFAAEHSLGRRLDELPRPHLVARHLEASSRPRDVFEVNVDDPGTLAGAAAPGAQHVALWLTGADLFARRDVALRALDLRLTVDPYAMLDVVLRPEAPFPLDLLDLLRARLAQATPSYASRALAHRGEDLQRRITVVLPETARFPRDWLDALRDEVSVYRDQSAAEAAARADGLGHDLPGARILDSEIEPATFRTLQTHADASAVCFANRSHELAWLRRTLD